MGTRSVGTPGSYASATPAGAANLNFEKADSLIGTPTHASGKSAGASNFQKGNSPSSLIRSRSDDSLSQRHSPYAYLNGLQMEPEEPWKQAGAETWTLVTQKGRYKDANLSTIQISYNMHKNGEYRLVSKTAHKRFYFRKKAPAAWFAPAATRTIEGQRASSLVLTEVDFDKVNNSVMLRMGSSAKLGKVANRQLFYLEQDGPRFIQFLIAQGRIQLQQGLTPQEMFIRHTVEKTAKDGEKLLVTGYNVTLNKDDWTNKMASGFVGNWAMQQTSKLRVYMKADGTLKHFKVDEFFGNTKFTISKITTYDEEYNRVRLTLRADESILDCAFRSGKGVADRWLHLDGTDSKKFLLFLMEMYHPQLTDNVPAKPDRFSRAAAAAIPTIFQDLKEENEKEVVRQYITERGNTDKAKQFYGICGVQERIHVTLPVNAMQAQRMRRRLAEAEARW